MEETTESHHAQLTRQPQRNARHIGNQDQEGQHGIQPWQHRKGLGYQLLEHSIAGLKNRPVQIFLEVRESNLAAIALYEKSGFHQIDLRKNYYPKTDGTREHAIIMVKSCSDDFASLFK